MTLNFKSGNVKISLFLFFNISMLYSYGQVEEAHFDSLLLNKPAPNFITQTLSGRTFNLKENKNKVVMINFWSLNCGACFKELADFNKIVKERKGKNFILISLMDNTMEEIANSIEKRGDFYKLKRPLHKNDSIEFEIIPDATKIMKDYYGFEKGFSFPFTVYVDENGIVRDLIYGYLLSYEGTGQITNYDAHNKIVNKLLK